MDKLEKKSYKTSRNLTYTYYVTPESTRGSGSKPAIALFHGWPDDAYLWQAVVPYLQKLDYPLFIPDLLGYAGTDKPSDPSLYNSRDMTKDIIEILDHEGIRSIISTGHDWGSFLAARMYLWHPNRVVGVILLNVAYSPPGPEPFDLDKTNAMMEKMFNYPRFAYWELFTAPDGPKILVEHVESLYTAIHGDEKDWMLKMFCTRGAMREFLLQDKKVPVKKYAQDPELERTWIARMKRDTFVGPQNWYHATRYNHHYNAERAIPPENFVIKVPVLYLGCTGDTVCLIELMEPPKQAGLLPNLETKIFDSAHWCTMEIPDQIGPAIVEWLESQKI